MMKPFIVITALFVLMLISMDNLQKNAGFSATGSKEYEVILPEKGKTTYSGRCGAESDALIKESQLSDHTGNASQNMASYMSGKIMANAFTIF